MIAKAREDELLRRIEELETDVRHLENELRLTKEEYDDAVAKYLDMYFNLERKVRKRTDELDAVNRRLHAEVEERRRTEDEKEALIGELRRALQEVKVLSGFLPICASCKKIRDDQGYWNQIEEYIGRHSQAQFSHGICPDCAERLYPDLHATVMEKRKRQGK
ncbi:MAG: hypothetical protein ACOY3Z_07470 [Thermodesulfobacteriota bacterium]